MASSGDHDLGFRYRTRKGGEVEIHREGRLASTLRGRAAEKFLRAAGDPDSPEAQQLMARVTGNYKRGNERVAKEGRKNRSSGPG